MDVIYRLNGAALVTIAKANALAAIPGNRVWIAVADNRYSAITRLRNVSVLDLAVHYYKEDNQGRWHAIIDLWKKRKYHRQRLELLLNDINPDVVISTGESARKFLPLLKLKSKPVFIREFHTSRHFWVEKSKKWFDKLLWKISELYDDLLIAYKYDKIVVLTRADKSGSWQTWDKVAIIPNPIIKQEKEHSTCTSKVAITAARLVDVKNYESLVNIWAKVVQVHPDWILQIWGNGPEENRLKEQINRMKLNNHVLLMGYTPDVQEQMAHASIFVLTSRTEGFSLVTIEAMSVGIPAVAYNCPGGLCYVLKDGKTGFCVPMNDEDAFVERLFILIENEELRKAMGQVALREAEQYRIEKITQRWMELFQELLDKKRG